MTGEARLTRAIADAVTALFVPGDRPERFAKAVASEAHLIVIDVEDAVAPEDKAAARQNIAEFLNSAEDRPRNVLVRMNALDSVEAPHDVALLHRLREQDSSGLAGVMIAKAESAESVRGLVAQVDASHEVAIVPLIETAQGIANCGAIAEVSGVTRLAFGAVDFALDIGAEDAHGSLDSARSALVLTSRLATIAAPLDAPSLEIRDVTAVQNAARRARAFGFGGKLCIHPAQLAAVARAFSPTVAEVEWALSIIGHGESAGQVDGQMVDRPVIARAARILASRRAATS